MRFLWAMLDNVRQAHRRFSAPGRVEVSGDTLVIFRWRRRAREIRLSDITSVIVYSVDLFSYDAFCTHIESENTPLGQDYLIYEDFAGFADAMMALERLPGFDRMWLEKAMLRSRTGELTIAYQRGGDGQR